MFVIGGMEKVRKVIEENRRRKEITTMGESNQAFMDSLFQAVQKKQMPQRKQPATPQNVDAVLLGAGEKQSGRSALQNQLEKAPAAPSVPTFPEPASAASGMPITERAESSTFVSVAALNSTKSAKGRLRVAAYIRVSTDMSDQEYSFRIQERYFNKLLENNPDWISAGVYADYGISGTGTEKRTGFQRLLRHCKEGRIDRIVTKSISRFARNTAQFLEALNILRESGTTILMEKENLDTADPTSEFILTTLAAIAQEESRSISENINVGNRMRFPRGEVPNAALYGYRYAEGHITTETGYRYRDIKIVEDEAEVVRWIFKSFLDGMGYREIARTLNQRHVPHRESTKEKRRKENSKKGELNADLDDGWTSGKVSCIIRNERYTGDVLIQKTYTEDYLTHKIRKNRGEVPQFYVTDHHPAIISRRTYKEAKKLREAAAGGAFDKTEYPFSGRLICGHCGRYFNIRNSQNNPIWFCPTAYRNNGKVNCRTERVYQEQIVRAFRKAIIERFSLTVTPVADDVTAADLLSGRYEAGPEAFTGNADGFVSQMLARLINLQRMDFMERDRAFLKRQMLAADTALDKAKKKVRLLKSRKEAMEIRLLVLNDTTVTNEMVEKVAGELAEAEKKLKAAEAESQSALNQLDYMENYWEEMEADHDRREEAIEWMKRLPEGREGVTAFLNGMTDRYAKAFILSITVHDPLHFTVHWFDDTTTEVEMYSNIEGYQNTSAYYDGQTMREKRR